MVVADNKMFRKNCVFCLYKNTLTAPTIHVCRRTITLVSSSCVSCVLYWCDAVVGSAVILYQPFFVFSLPAGHPPFIHYLKSCSISCVGCEAWQHIPVQHKKGVGVYFNELCVWLTSFFALSEPNMKGSKRQSQKAWPGTVWGCRSLLRTTRGAQDERFQWELKNKKKDGWRKKRGDKKVAQSDIRTSERDLPLSWPHLKVSG